MRTTRVSPRTAALMRERERMQTPTISYCLNNVDAETRGKLLRCGFPVIEDCCLQRCGRCYDGPFLLVDEELMSGPTHAALFDALMSTYESKEGPL